MQQIILLKTQFHLDGIIYIINAGNCAFNSCCIFLYSVIQISEILPAKLGKTTCSLLILFIWDDKLSLTGDNQRPPVLYYNPRFMFTLELCCTENIQYACSIQSASFYCSIKCSSFRSLSSQRCCWAAAGLLKFFLAGLLKCVIADTSIRNLPTRLKQV